MCRRCDAGHQQPNLTSRRTFLKATASTGIAAAGSGLFGSPAADAQATAAPSGSGKPGRRYIIRGGAVLSMDHGVGDFAQAAVLVEGKKIVAVGPKLEAPGAAVIDARGKIVMPGFIDTHHHQFETALRGFLAGGLLANDGKPHGAINYFDYVLGKCATACRRS